MQNCAESRKSLRPNRSSWNCKTMNCSEPRKSLSYPGISMPNYMTLHLSPISLLMRPE